MTYVETLTVRLYAEMREWLGFREGYSAYLLDAKPDYWAVQSDQTRRWKDRLGMLALETGPDGGFDVPARSLVALLVDILAEGQGKRRADVLRRILRENEFFEETGQSISPFDRLAACIVDATSRKPETVA